MDPKFGDENFMFRFSGWVYGSFLDFFGIKSMFLGKNLRVPHPPTLPKKGALVMFDRGRTWQNDLTTSYLQNSTTMNKVTPLLAAPWIPCIFWNAFSSFCEPLQYFVGFLILVHVKILCIFQYFYLVLWYLHYVLEFQVPKPQRQAVSFRSCSTFWFHLQLCLLEI